MSNKEQDNLAEMSAMNIVFEYYDPPPEAVWATASWRMKMREHFIEKVQTEYNAIKGKLDRLKERHKFCELRRGGNATPIC
jgi:hypothetical protein